MHAQVISGHVSFSVCVGIRKHVPIIMSSPSLQTVVERDQQISQLQRTCDEVRREKKRRSITASDMDNEVSKLTKVSESTLLCVVLPIAIGCWRPVGL